jgi:hypothetical protein
VLVKKIEGLKQKSYNKDGKIVTQKRSRSSLLLEERGNLE